MWETGALDTLKKEAMRLSIIWVTSQVGARFPEVDLGFLPFAFELEWVQPEEPSLPGEVSKGALDASDRG